MLLRILLKSTKFPLRDLVIKWLNRLTTLFCNKQKKHQQSAVRTPDTFPFALVIICWTSQLSTLTMKFSLLSPALSSRSNCQSKLKDSLGSAPRVLQYLPAEFWITNNITQDIGTITLHSNGVSSKARQNAYSTSLLAAMLAGCAVIKSSSIGSHKQRLRLPCLHNRE